MSKLLRFVSFGCAAALLLVPVCPAAVAPEQPKPPAEPAKIEITVSPQPVPVGGSAVVTVELAPKSGIRINRYPKIKLVVPEQDGLAAEAEAAIGNDGPPPAGQTEANYYDQVDPLTLSIDLDPGAKAGDHEFDAKLIYFYCVKKSGFCAPKKIDVKIPVQVR